MKTDATHLLACPFCGPGTQIRCHENPNDKWQVWCGACGSSSGFAPDGSRDKAMEGWNRRAADRLIPELPDGCKLYSLWQTNDVFSCEIMTTEIIERGGLKQFKRVGGHGLPTLRESVLVAIAAMQRDPA